MAEYVEAEEIIIKFTEVRREGSWLNGLSIWSISEAMKEWQKAKHDDQELKRANRTFISGWDDLAPFQASNGVLIQASVPSGPMFEEESGLDKAYFDGLKVGLVGSPIWDELTEEERKVLAE